MNRIFPEAVTYGTTGRQAQTGLADTWSRYLPAAIGNPAESVGGNHPWRLDTLAWSC